VASEPPATLLYSLPTVERPVISPELARAVVTLQFGEGPEDLEGCLSVYDVSYPKQASVAAANERSGLYDQQANGTTAPTWSDLLDGKKSRSLQLPTDWFQLRLVLGAFHRWLQILLGEQHCLPVGILRLFTAMDKLAPLYLNAWIKGPQQCAELMTCIDIYTRSWVEQQQSSPTPTTHVWHSSSGCANGLHPRSQRHSCQWSSRRATATPQHRPRARRLSRRPR
jgi:hypothetical protein